MSSDDRINCFLDQVCLHLYWPPYRHGSAASWPTIFLSRAEYLHQDRGMDWDKAVDLALQSLGEPNELGRSLRHARFPLLYVLCVLFTGLVWAAIAACLAYLLMFLIQ